MIFCVWQKAIEHLPTSDGNFYKLKMCKLENIESTKVIGDNFSPSRTMRGHWMVGRERLGGEFLVVGGPYTSRDSAEYRAIVSNSFSSHGQYQAKKLRVGNVYKDARDENQPGIIATYGSGDGLHKSKITRSL